MYDSPRLAAIQFFLCLADERHYGRAARRLGISQPALTQLVKRLEEQFGVALIERSGRQFALTAAGAMLVDEGKRLVGYAATTVENVRSAARGERGCIRLALLASCSLGVVAKAIRTLRSEQPDVLVELHDDPPNALAAVAAGMLDGACLRGPVKFPGIVTELVLEEPLIAVVPSSHRLAARDHVAVGELAAEQFVMFRRSASPPLYDTIIAECDRAGFVPAVAQEAAEWQTVASLVVCDIGIALVPRSAREIAHLDLRYLDLEAPVGKVNLMLARAESGSTRVVDHMVHHLRAAVTG